MKILKSTFILTLFTPILSLANTQYLNDLNCTNYIEESKCMEIYNIYQKENLSSYQLATFDNQLKKITFLLNKDKDDIAKKKYDYFFKSIKEDVNERQKSILSAKKDDIWDLIVNYSKSEDYTPNPKYKLK